MALAVLVLAPHSAEAGLGICPNCWTDILRNGCLTCVINPAPAYCSCSTVGTCPQVATNCGNCHGSSSCGGSYCSEVCPGCCKNPGGGNCCLAPGKAVEMKPVIGSWISNANIVESAKATSPLISKVLVHLQQLSDRERACTNLQGRVYDRQTNEISKLSIITNPGGITTVTVYTRSLDQEDTLIVHPAEGRWALSRASNVLEPTPGPIATLGQGSFPSQAAPSK